MGNDGLLFQVGFNKCATTALNKLFHRSGVRVIHGAGRYWKSHDHPQVVGRSVQKVIQDNIAAGRPAVETLDDFQAFFDMEFRRPGVVIENFRHFEAMARAYPHARFILNTRDKAAWLRSRARHNDGNFITLEMERLNLDRKALLKHWSDDFDRHHAAVRSFFRAERDRLLIFDIDKMPIKKLVRFCKPEIVVWPRFWKHMRVTDEVARANSWTDAPIADTASGQKA